MHAFMFLKMMVIWKEGMVSSRSSCRRQPGAPLPQSQRELHLVEWGGFLPPLQFVPKALIPGHPSPPIGLLEVTPGVSKFSCLKNFQTASLSPEFPPAPRYPLLPSHPFQSSRRQVTLLMAVAFDPLATGELVAWANR